MADVAAVAGQIDARDVVLGFQAGSTLDAIPKLLDPALRRRLDAAAVQPILDAALRREQEISTRCGALLLPHARSAAVSEFILAAGTNAAGVIAGQSEPRLIVAFVSPFEQRDQHLRLLASLARLAKDAAAVARIVAASTPEEVIDLLRSAGI
ncbi:MAG TPA: PTS sugar transporter subunit IIA [Thermoanaerobaculia bacterium]|nr:PTS sugar transporter subunit IIA [Thermoanaerobaculia bacterium]